MKKILKSTTFHFVYIPYCFFSSDDSSLDHDLVNLNHDVLIYRSFPELKGKLKAKVIYSTKGCIFFFNDD